jgi:hypothetical protein
MEKNPNDIVQKKHIVCALAYQTSLWGGGSITAIVIS